MDWIHLCAWAWFRFLNWQILINAPFARLFCFCWKWNYRGRYKYLICHWKVTHPDIQINIKLADLYSWMKKSYIGWLCLVQLTKFKKILWKKKKKRWKGTTDIKKNNTESIDKLVQSMWRLILKKSGQQFLANF